MHYRAIAATFLLLSSAGAAAQEAQSSEAAPGDENTVVIEEKVVCKSDRETGSRVRTNRVCRTESEWKAIADRSREEMENERGSGDFVLPDPSAQTAG